MAYVLFRDGLEEKVDSPPIVSRTHEGHAVETYSIGGKERFFVTLAGSHYCAHGDTLAEAIGDAIWKDEKRRPTLQTVKDTIRSEGRERKITLQEFRTLTGACQAGCRAALRKEGLDTSPMTADQIRKYFPEWGRKLLQVLEWEA